MNQQLYYSTDKVKQDAMTWAHDATLSYVCVEEVDVAFLANEQKEDLWI